MSHSKSSVIEKVWPIREDISRQSFPKSCLVNVKVTGEERMASSLIQVFATFISNMDKNGYDSRSSGDYCWDINKVIWWSSVSRL